MTPFTALQWTELSGALALMPERAVSPDRQTIDTRALCNVQRCRAILDLLGPTIGSSSRAITASLFAKRIAFLVTGPSLYAMSRYDQGLDCSIENCVTDYTHRDGVWQSRMVLKSLVTQRPTPGHRESWRDTVIHRIFAEHLAPLWETFQAASGIAPRILWENTAVRVYSLYERRLAKLDDANERARALEDFNYLTHTAAPELFGLSSNPIRRYYFEPTCVPSTAALPQQAIRFRKTCCLYFKATQPPEYCSTCPLIRPSASLRT